MQPNRAENHLSAACFAQGAVVYVSPPQPIRFKASVKQLHSQERFKSNLHTVLSATSRTQTARADITEALFTLWCLHCCCFFCPFNECKDKLPPPTDCQWISAEFRFLTRHLGHSELTASSPHIWTFNPSLASFTQAVGSNMLRHHLEKCTKQFRQMMLFGLLNADCTSTHCSCWQIFSTYGHLNIASVCLNSLHLAASYSVFLGA